MWPLNIGHKHGKAKKILKVQKKGVLHPAQEEFKVGGTCTHPWRVLKCFKRRWCMSKQKVNDSFRERGNCYI